CATCTLREDVMARTSRRCGGIEGSTYGQNSDANREYDHDKARDYDIAHINRLLILPMDLARLVACKMRKNQEDQCHEQRKDVGIEIAPTQNIIQHELVYRRLQCGEEYGAQNKPPSRYLFTVGRSLQPSEDDAVIFFQQSAVFLLPDSIDRCPDHGSCARYSIFRRVRPTDSGRSSERLPARPRNELVRRLGYMPLASFVSSAGTTIEWWRRAPCSRRRTQHPA